MAAPLKVPEHGAEHDLPVVARIVKHFTLRNFDKRIGPSNRLSAGGWPPLATLPERLL